MRNRTLYRFIIGLAFWSWLFTIGAVKAEALESGEEAIKTAFLYNFAKFVDWPPESFKNEASSFILGIVGVEPFGASLDTLRDKTVKGRKLIIRKLPRLENFEECHMLFISGSEKGNLKTLLTALKNHNILTVSDLDRFAQQGGMIGLIQSEGKINFEVNIETVQHSRLKFSSQLLKLAKIVRTGS